MPASISVLVKPGETTPEVAFRLLVPEAPIIERQLPAQQAAEAAVEGNNSGTAK